MSQNLQVWAGFCEGALKDLLGVVSNFGSVGVLQKLGLLVKEQNTHAIDPEVREAKGLPRGGGALANLSTTSYQQAESPQPIMRMHCRMAALQVGHPNLHTLWGNTQDRDFLVMQFSVVILIQYLAIFKIFN